MRAELLYKIADIINSNSTKYRAVIPRVSNRPKNHINRSIWNIYENDIDRIIKKIARRDMDFAQRIDKGEPTLFDIEVIVRRASFQALKLKLVKTAYDIYLENG